MAESLWSAIDDAGESVFTATLWGLVVEWARRHGGDFAIVPVEASVVRRTLAPRSLEARAALEIVPERAAV